MKLLHSLIAEAVTFFHAVGNIGNDSSPLLTQKVSQKAGGGDAVHVVIAVDGYDFMLFQRPVDARYRTVHIFQQEGIVKQFRAVIQESAGLFRRIQSAGTEHHRRQRWDTGVDHSLVVLSLWGADIPLLVLHGGDLK